MNPFNPNLFRCVIERSKPAPALSGLVIHWSHRTISVRLDLSSELLLDEQVTLTLNHPVRSQKGTVDRCSSLRSRVVSLTWLGSREIVVLAIRAVSRPDFGNTDYKHANRSPQETVS